MNIEFTGKTAIVTGAAHGIGRSIVHQLAATGAHVWACDILSDALRKTVAVRRAPEWRQRQRRRHRRVRR